MTLPTQPVSPVNWTFACGPWNGLPTTALTVLTSRTVTFRLTGNSEAAFTTDGQDPKAATIQELISDVWLMRNGQTLFRGRVGSAEDTVDPAAGDIVHKVAFAAADYRAVLDRRLILDGDTVTWTSTDQAQAAWALISQTQGKTGGSLGITQGPGSSTGVAVSPTFSVGATVAASVNQLANADNGFDWDILPASGTTTMQFVVYYPERGTDKNVTLAYPGGRVASFTRTVDPGAFANVVRYTGDTSLTPVVAQETGIATDPAGRFESQIGDTTILTQDALNASAASVLATQETVTPAWVITLLPNTWGGPADMWLGDPVTLAVTSGRLQVLETLRVFEIAITIDDTSEAETVAVTLGAVDPDLRWHPRAFDTRLVALEKR